MSIEVTRVPRRHGASVVAGLTLFGPAAEDAQYMQSGYAGIGSALRNGAR
jgi:hypothetical protein